MTIVFVTPVYPPYRAGMAHVAYEEAVHLASRGHAVHVVTLSKHRSVVQDEHGVTIHRLRAELAFGNAGWAFEWWRWLREVPVDVVHLHAPFFGVQEQMVLSFPKEIPLVMSYHMDLVAHGFVKRVAAISRAAFLPRLLKRADRVIVASRDYAQSSWLYPHWELIEKKLAEIPFGVDLTRFCPSSRLPLTSTQPLRILFVGALDRAHYFKGLPELLRALEGLREHEWRLTIVGDGDWRARYEALCRELYVSDRVTFAGRVQSDALPAMYAQAGMFVLPSVDRSEAFGLVALEAQASGVPVIVSDLPGVRTVIDPGKTGILAKPGDVASLRESLETLLGDAPRRQAMGRAARAHAERYSWDVHVDMLEQMYHSEPLEVRG
ncbi:hypothetical protein A3C17_04225 [Candidatus Uhrbacteria bacterium RIFCSPHIGHO2_02_FULL_53_13]|uniref:Glycosyltransferase subfamily 4-like N-terminal domain-containing protein n=1 Tax=Candidatus Uhrbacteria bacterium RIFCSPHIGHO2_02_FULL_53_13 TaxID=1802389 RepID=A0A1F7TWI1_9BACT|nr:MAG: hypothetical protein A3C17_04225 [Candidatus Uhrbacteria bacterium RIFCSPHIGHO2_02_FULL_53_13]